MGACCYVLFSQNLNVFYVGACFDDLNQRIVKHNAHAYGKSKFTAKTADWQLFVEIPAHDYKHALRMERFIKSMKSRKYIENLKLYPELVTKIVLKTKIE